MRSRTTTDWLLGRGTALLFRAHGGQPCCLCEDPVLSHGCYLLGKTPDFNATAPPDLNSGFKTMSLWVCRRGDAVCPSPPPAPRPTDRPPTDFRGCARADSRTGERVKGASQPTERANGGSQRSEPEEYANGVRQAQWSEPAELAGGASLRSDPTQLANGAAPLERAGGTSQRSVFRVRSLQQLRIFV